MTDQAIWLLCGLLVAHYLGDFTPLANARIQEAKANGGPLGLIFLHAGIHAVLVAAVIFLLVGAAPTIIAIAMAIELVSHFLLDVGRARLGVRFPALRDPAQNAFWYTLGVDQLAHGLVLVGLAGMVV